MGIDLEYQRKKVVKNLFRAFVVVWRMTVTLSEDLKGGRAGFTTWKWRQKERGGQIERKGS